MGKEAKELWKLYEVDYKNMRITFKGRKCPRCGKFMAHHLNPMSRWSCGGCGYTEYERKQ
ncbi:MAG: 30S ribosomal protein S27ae [Candidatus Bathyarchaeia archaeon]